MSKCKHEAWEQYPHSRRCADCHAWLAVEMTGEELSQALSQQVRDLLDEGVKKIRGALSVEDKDVLAEIVAEATSRYRKIPPVWAAHKTTDYCARCGESPDSGTHLHGHDYVPPGKVKP